MEIRKYPVNERVTVEAKAHGNLNLVGIDGTDIEITADSNTLKIERMGDRLEVLCFSDCLLKIPTVAKGIVDRVGGEAVAMNYSQDLEIRKVGGDFQGENLGSLALEKVGGGVRLHSVRGTAEIDKIGGDFDGQDIDMLSVRKTGGDLRAAVNAIQGEFRVGGDIHLDVKSFGAEDVFLKAGGDIFLRLPADVAVILNIKSDGEQIHVQLGDQVANINARDFQGIFGENGPTLTLDAGGSVAVGDPNTKDFEDDFDFSDEFDWDFHLNPGSMFDRFNHPTEPISAYTERITDAVNRRAEAAVRRAEARVEVAMRRVERRAPGPAVNFTPPPVSPSSTSAAPAGEQGKKAVSDEERLAVLRMLQEKKITLEQAERLLAVLEGRPE